MIQQIPKAVRDAVLHCLQASHSTVALKNFSFTGGGCINHGGKIETSEGDYFLKWNDAKKFPKMFEAEARGLKLLQAVEAIPIPLVIGYGEGEGLQYLLLEFVDPKGRSKSYWKILGEQLASVHRASSAMFGLDHNNYIGSLPQVNNQKYSWVDFFIHERIEVQLKMADASGKANVQLRKQFEELYRKLPSLIPEGAPSLLHGDLWNGNLLTNENGQPCLIDPAVYFGDREADLAMTKLFGGFDKEFYESYHDVYPLSPGYEKRFDLYNLYPLLVHVNLFGGGYLSQVKSILGYYTTLS